MNSMSNDDKESKRSKGQFYTTNCDYILDEFGPPSDTATRIVEPFAGKGDLVRWAKQRYTLPVEGYDIDPKQDGIVRRDTLRDPPDYSGAWVITNPPYLARNKNQEKEIYDMYGTNDLYKCFLANITATKTCVGGILIIPAGFFLSSRDLDVRCRSEFMRHYRITKVRYFEEAVFNDTSTTIVAFSFVKSDSELTEQDVEWKRMPSGETRTFHMDSEFKWIIGGDIYNIPISDTIQIRRHVEGQPLKNGEVQTFLTLDALDSGREDGKIQLRYQKGHVYPAKECSRSYATLRISGRVLSEQEQQAVSERFNEFVNAKRTETWSLFLPQYRESKEYARKRIPFDLAYRIVNHIILSLNQAK